MRLRKTFRWLWLLPVLLAGVILFAPWHAWVEQKLIAAIHAQGYGPATLTLDHVGIDGIALRDVTLGEPPLKLARVTVGYQLRALLKGELNTVRIHGLNVNVTQDELGWNVEGLPPAPSTKEPSKKTTLPVNAEALNALPFAQLNLVESAVHVAAKKIEASMKLDAMLQHGAATGVRLDGHDVAIKLPSATITIGGINAQMTLDDAAQQWQGKWALDDIAIASESMTVPPLKASGTITVFSDAVQFTGSLTSDDKTHEAQFAGEYSLVQPDRSHVKLLHGHLPWSGGEIAINNTKFPLGGNAALALTLEVKKVAIDTLLQALTGSKATASGVVSGELPLRISKTGAITIGKTSLKAEGPGIIALSPEVIPGDNAQVTMVRDLLKNLHYTVLALDLEMAPDNTLSARLVVEGENPDAQAGRPVKLNVHLSGDLLNFIVQNTQLMTDPKSFIEQKNDE